jgi:hypothetical protein
MPHTGDMNNNGEPDYLETDENGNFFLRCNLAPLADKVVTAALFVGESTAELDQKCQTALEFHNSGYDLSPYFGEPAMPVIYDIANNDHRIQVMWDLFSDPDELTLLYKDTESTQWLSVDITPYHTQYICEEITNEGIYQFKLAADFDDVYLETVPVEYYFDPASINVHNELIASQTLGVYPNPFNPSTTVFWKQDEDCNTTIDIYNLKGQKVRTLTNQLYSTGNHTLTWNGCDTSGNICPSGIYLIKLNNSTQSLTRKALLLK